MALVGNKWKFLEWNRPIDSLMRILRKNDGAVNRMVAAIKEYGMPIPILGRHRGDKIEIVDGHPREGFTQDERSTIPVVFCNDWSEAQVKAFRILVNVPPRGRTSMKNCSPWNSGDLNVLDFDLA